ncbi:right-handed parallel beta-helix repeat-containing protein [Fulvivirga sediminis]|uniref:Right-handed parallel beta-helix repeat-containing protein n=1 Tax=Fulvivirga sediminis TaxID=2803949 RepID=A0A937F9H3_9BACT|nr:right-handed parallel beta-helix repeat-containing protein [Fulvivirga sediminis]MBL3658952.1 right-handed parallel beta-helix repeat-containing protein [Fulvivirga sediminis]
MKTLLFSIIFLFTIGVYAQNVHVYSNESIQAAINEAQSGDVILIHAGTYSEALNIENRSNLKLTAAGDGEVIIQGDGNRVNTIGIENPSNISVIGLTIKNIRKKAWSTGIAVTGSGSGVTISNNKFTDFSYRSGSWDPSDNPGDNMVGVNPLMIAGTETSAPLSDVIIEGNEVSYCITGWNESITVKGNVDGFIVTHNTVHHVTNIAIDAYGLGDWPNAMQARNGEISYNTVYEAKCNYTDNGGIYVDGGKDIVVSNNTIYNSKYGITLGCENQGVVPNGVTSGITIINNLIYGNEKSGIMIGTSGDDDGVQGDVVNCTISGNTFLKNSTTDSWGTEIVLQYCSEISVYNNIFYGLYQPMITEALGVSDNSFGYNNFYNAQGKAPVISKQTNSGWTTLTFQQFKNKNNDQTSFFADPKLANANTANVDARLTSDSPGIDSGSPGYVPLPSETDLNGNMRVHNGRIDIGVYEFGSSAEGDEKEDSAIIVDGQLNDWSVIESVDVKNDQTAQWLKVYEDNNNLYFAVKGTGMNSSNYHFYINSDNNYATGYKISEFNKSGAEYMIENGALYQYTGNGTSWGWSSLGSVASAKSAKVTEVSVPKSMLSLSGTFLTGYADISDGWSTVSTLGFAPYALSGKATGREAFLGNKKTNAIIYPNPVRDVLTINLGEYEGEAQLYLYDINGRLLLKEATDKSIYFITNEMQQLSSPAILKVVKEGDTETFKILIVK